jgi:cytochrome c553
MIVSPAIFARPLAGLLLGVGLFMAIPALADAAAGKQKSQVCQGCHGVDGNNTNPQFPRLAGQYPDYLAQALHEYKSGERKNAIMQGFAANLSDQDIADITAYFASQTGLQVEPPPAPTR